MGQSFKPPTFKTFLFYCSWDCRFFTTLHIKNAELKPSTSVISSLDRVRPQLATTLAQPQNIEHSTVQHRHRPFGLKCMSQTLYTNLICLQMIHTSLFPALPCAHLKSSSSTFASAFTTTLGNYFPPRPPPLSEWKINLPSTFRLNFFPLPFNIL